MFVMEFRAQSKMGSMRITKIIHYTLESCGALQTNHDVQMTHDIYTSTSQSVTSVISGPEYPVTYSFTGLAAQL